MTLPNTVAGTVGRFREADATLDLTGKLTTGAFNTVELASDTTGGLIASLSVDAYRKIGGNA